MKFLTLFFIISFFAINSFANEIHVPKDYATIQEAIDASEKGDVILVDRGTYYENISFKGKRITVTSNFYKTKDRKDIEETIIDGSKYNDIDKRSVVTFNKNENFQAVLNGFTITGGRGTKTGNEGTFFRTGGGILIDYASPTISNNIIRNNACITGGGVSGAGGGGIRMGYGKPMILNNIIKQNKGGYAGGIMIAYCQGAVIMNNVIVGNHASGAFNGGGGVYVDWENINLVNNTIINNTSGDKGGGIISTGALTTFVNCIVYGNKANNGSDQIMKRFGGRAKIIYSCIEGGFSGTTEGMIMDNPMIADTTNYYLSPNSPCIDAGQEGSQYEDNVDPSTGMAKFPSLGTTKNDMGAYGGKGVSEVVGTIDQEFVQGINFQYANPYSEKGIVVSSEIKTTLKMNIFGMNGEWLVPTQKIEVNQGKVTIPLHVNHSCFVIFTDEKGNNKVIKIIQVD